MVGALMLITALSGCTARSEGSAAEENLPERTPSPQARRGQSPVRCQERAEALSPAIPIYAGVQKISVRTTHRRDSVMIKNQYGRGLEVYTLATDGLVPSRSNITTYTTYRHSSAPIRASPPYPPPQKIGERSSATDQAMQDPFIRRQMLRVTDKQVMLRWRKPRRNRDGDSGTSLRPVGAGQQQVAAK